MKRRIAAVVALLMALMALPVSGMAEAEDEGPMYTFIAPRRVVLPESFDDPVLQEKIRDGTFTVESYGGEDTAVIVPYGDFTLGIWFTSGGKPDYAYVSSHVSASDREDGTVSLFAQYSAKGELTLLDASERYTEADTKYMFFDSLDLEGKTQVRWSIRQILTEKEKEVYLYTSQKGKTTFVNYWPGVNIPFQGKKWNHFKSVDGGRAEEVAEMDPRFTRVRTEFALYGVLDCTEYPAYPVPEQMTVKICGEERTGTLLAKDGYLYVDLGDNEVAVLKYAGKAGSADPAAAFPGKKIVAIMDYCYTVRKGNADPDDVTVFEYDGSIYDCTAKIGKVSLPDTLVTIGAHAFDSLQVKEITLPDSVAEIGEGAFTNCAKMKSFTIPAKVTRIAKDTFKGCKGLASVRIPASVTEIDATAFEGHGAKLVLTVTEGSYAEAWATEHGIRAESVPGE